MQDSERNFLMSVEEVAKRHGRYKRQAYLFVYAALEYTVQYLERDRSGTKEALHVTGQELSRGIAVYAREQYGPMALAVFTHWGIHETLDFGRIVFQLIDGGIMHKTEEDSLEDFRDVYDLCQALDPKRIQSNLNRTDLARLQL